MAPIRAAGILYLTPAGQALFLQRGPTGDHAGEWCLPGGCVEAGETAEQAALREAREELGSAPKGDMVLHTRQVRDVVGGGPATPALTEGTAGPVVEAPLAPDLPALSVDYTTFLQKVPEPFEVQLNSESTAFAWAPVTSPPQPLHPGVGIAISRLGMNELEIALAMSQGQLTSPQRYENVSLFLMRITGTGTAYRTKINEYVYRRPENYLTEEFLARCAGLPVIWEHPKKSNLTSKEYSDRNIGSIMLPFIRGDEVWGVAKIYDASAIQLMETEQLSTSPAVFFRNLADNTKLKLEDGSVLLIEGKPSLLDHLAVCGRGVWDKGGEPSGVEVQLTREDSDMTEAEKKAAEDKARQDAEKARRDGLSPEEREKEKKDAEEAEEAKKKADAEAGTLLDKCLKGIDSISQRMDAMDAKDKEKADAEAKIKADAEEEARRKGDPDVVAADKARKDAEEKAAAEDKEKKDAEERAKIKADSEQALKDIADLRSRLTPRSDEDHGKLMEAQSRADSVFAVHDGRAPRPLDGETELGYRRRIAAKLQPHSPAWKDVNLGAIADDAAFAIAEGQIYADADRAGRKPVELPAGTLREIITPDSTGRAISTFHGEPGAWISGFSGSRRRLTGIRNAT